MSLKSIDMVTMVPRLTEVGKAQQVREQEGQTAQQQFAAQLQSKVIQEQRQVNLPSEAARAQAKRDGDRSGRGGRGKREGSGRCEREGAAAPGPAEEKQRPADGKGSVIDIILEA